MTIEKVIEELKYKDDTIRMSDQQLIAKYGKNEDRAFYFIGMLDITYGMYYPVIISDQFPKLKKVLNNLNERYAKGTEFEQIVENRKRDFDLEVEKIKHFGDKTNYDGMLFTAIALPLGLENLNGVVTYEALNHLLLENTKKIKEAYDKNPFFPSQLDYQIMLEKAEKIGLQEDPMKELALLNAYYDKFPLLTLSHDKNVLLL